MPLKWPHGQGIRSPESRIWLSLSPWKTEGLSEPLSLLGIGNGSACHPQPQSVRRTLVNGGEISLRAQLVFAVVMIWTQGSSWLSLLPVSEKCDALAASAYPPGPSEGGLELLWL